MTCCFLKEPNHHYDENTVNLHTPLTTCSALPYYTRHLVFILILLTICFLISPNMAFIWWMDPEIKFDFLGVVDSNKESFVGQTDSGHNS